MDSDFGGQSFSSLLSRAASILNSIRCSAEGRVHTGVSLTVDSNFGAQAFPPEPLELLRYEIRCSTEEKESHMGQSLIVESGGCG